MFKQLRKYGGLVAAISSTLLLLLYFNRSHFPDFESELKSFEQSFQLQEKILDFELDRAAEICLNGDVNSLWEDKNQNPQIAIHAYRRDSLKYWNTNEMPILRYADIHFPSEGINHLQNGWYYTKIRKLDKNLIAASFLIKSEYSYENEDLVNDFASPFNWKIGVNIGIDPEEGRHIKDGSGTYRFSILSSGEPILTAKDSLVNLLLMLLTIFLWISQLSKFRSKSIHLKWIIPLVVIGLRAVSIYYGWTSYFADDYSFSPALYGGNWFVSNIADYLINLMIIGYVLFWFYEIVGDFRKRGRNISYYLILLAAALPIWILIDFTINDLIKNSQIPIVLNEVFTLNMYSFLVLLGWGANLLFYFLFLKEIISQLLEDMRNPTRSVFFIFVYGFSFFIWYYVFTSASVIESLFPLIVMLSVFLIGVRKSDRNPLGAGLFQLFVFTLALSFILNARNEQREHEDRKLYADQLALDKDVEAEWEYAKLSARLEEDKLLTKVTRGETQLSRSDFQEIMERRFFNGFWERYDIEFDLFGTNGKSIFNSEQDLSHMNELIRRAGDISTLDTGIIYLKNYSSSYNYLIRKELMESDSLRAYFVATLRTKKIPEEIGFPRLLISKDANVLKPLENYSIAKYNDGKLVSQHGEFGFPTRINVFGETHKNKSFFHASGYEHYYLQRSGGDEVLLSRRDSNLYDQLTAFSYLFSLYGLILLPVLFRNRRNKFKETMTLAMRIQLMLIFIVFIALLGFGFGSGIFIRSQYDDYTKQVISEKLSSVDVEVRSKVGDYDYLSTGENREYLQQLLQKFAITFNTDINMYDEDGYLLATSKPKLFNMGIVSEQINPEAYMHLTLLAKSKYVHEENIGELNYASAYRPFYNQGGTRLAFINLQHFGKQSELESQIQGLLVAIINIFILLLALTVLLALMVSNWLTIPLRRLQESLINIRFGKHNDPIPYAGDDEIGSLVKAYNQKLEELAFTADQLARSERESAWREMAKQVAHEIKNPLTPMKLSVQQLLRTYDPNDPNSKAKLERVANSIVEQIDALTNIANEFSSFAKLPQLKESEVDLIELTKTVLALFEGEYNCTFEFDVHGEDALISGDKDQMMRVLNNLLKNAIQAIPSDKEGVIKVQIEVSDKSVILKVTDNGIGISREERKNLFVPYFTTKSTGTGLGLAMVKQIIENHKGTIHVESEKGSGAGFIIEIPRIKA